jgi:hypothetical protein
MAIEPWWYVAGAVLLAGTLRGILALRRAASRWRQDGEEGSLGDELACPHCGAPNNAEYRFCHTCVGALDGSGSVADPDATPTHGPAS